MFAASEIFSSRADDDSDEENDSFMRFGSVPTLSDDDDRRDDDGDDSSLTTLYLNSDEEQQDQQPAGLKDNQINRLPIIQFSLPKISSAPAAVSDKNLSSKKSGGKRSHKESKHGGASKAGSSSGKSAAPENSAGGAPVDPDRVQCSICMSDYGEGDPLRLLLCFHRFHKDCIDPWLMQKPECPICRTKIDIPDEGGAAAS